MDALAEEQAWRVAARQEIASVKQHFIDKKTWQIKTEEAEDRVTLYIQMQHQNHPERRYVLRLVYGQGFPQIRPREGFVNPDDYSQDGEASWPAVNQGPFKTNNNQLLLCLIGTWGFHEILHKDQRDPLYVNLTHLLLEIQTCIDRIP